MEIDVLVAAQLVTSNLAHNVLEAAHLKPISVIKFVGSIAQLDL